MLVTTLPDPVQTPAFYQGVALKRGIAFVVDALLIGVIGLVLLPFTAFLGLFFLPLFFLVVGFFYRVATITSGSATWGMRLMAIELRNAQGARLSGSEAFLHTAGFSLSMAFPPLQLISAVMMIVTPQGQGLTDMVLGTTALNRAA